MKKYLILIMVLCIVIMMVGCGREEAAPSAETESVEEAETVVEKRAPLVTILSDGQETVLPEYWFCGMEWVEGENPEDGIWVYSDGEYLCDMLDEVSDELPEVTYGKDFSLKFDENVEFKEINVYDASYEEFMYTDDVDVLSQIPPGIYYADVVVFEFETEEREGETGYGGYACGFKLKIPGPVTVVLNEEEIFPIQNCYEAEYQMDEGWVEASGSVVEEDFYNNAPEVIIWEDFSVKFAENVHLDRIILREETSEETQYFTEPDALKKLSEGSYYVDFFVTEYGKEYDGKREYWKRDCAFKFVILDEKPSFVTIISNGKEIAAHEELRYSESMDEAGAIVSADYIPFEDMISELHDQLPVVTWQEGIALEIDPQAEFRYISVFDSSREFIGRYKNVSDLSELENGEYYVSVLVFQEHKKGSSGYDCGFILNIP